MYSILYMKKSTNTIVKIGKINKKVFLFCFFYSLFLTRYSTCSIIIYVRLSKTLTKRKENQMRKRKFKRKEKLSTSEKIALASLVIAIIDLIKSFFK